MTQQIERSETGYSPGHPWYYKLGGRILYPKEILSTVKESGYHGYARDDIQTASEKAEPERSHALRKLRAKFREDLARDLSGYRHCAFQLQMRRKAASLIQEGGLSDDIEMNISLKHNHLFNIFAHLIWIDELLSKQPDLFN